LAYSLFYLYNKLRKMALTESNMMAIGSLAPNFALLDTISGEQLSYEDIKGQKGTVIFFTCNHCPYVIHLNEAIVKLANEYLLNGIGFVAISSNDVEKYPQDSPEKMSLLAREQNYPFPYLYDATQDVAKAYEAACTPDIYVFDAEEELVYRGRFDQSRPGNDVPPTGADLREAIDLMLKGMPITENQYPSAGCGIKWKQV